MKKMLLGLAMVAIVVSGCAGSTPKTDEENLQLITSIAPLYSLTANLVEGVDKVELNNLVPPNVSVHNFSLSPQLAKDSANADLIIINGLGLEEFLEDNFELSDARIVDTSKGVEVLASDEEEHGPYDPHIWLSPVNAKVQATNIAEALAGVDPEHAQIYSENLENLKLRLDELDLEVKDALSSLEIGPYIVFHDAYHYFERDFEVHAAAFLEEFPGKEPSAKYLSEIADLIESENIQAIFAERQFSRKLIDTLAGDYDLKVGELDPLGLELSKDGYFKLIRANLNAFAGIFNEKL